MMVKRLIQFSKTFYSQNLALLNSAQTTPKAGSGRLIFAQLKGWILTNVSGCLTYSVSTSLPPPQIFVLKTQYSRKHSGAENIKSHHPIIGYFQTILFGRLGPSSGRKANSSEMTGRSLSLCWEISTAPLCWGGIFPPSLKMPVTQHVKEIITAFLLKYRPFSLQMENNLFSLWLPCCLPSGGGFCR